MNESPSPFFSPAELGKLKSLQGRTLQGVRYVFWMNLASRDGTFEALDWIELNLGRAGRISFRANEDRPGLVVTDLDLDKEKEKIKAQFGEQVELRSEEMGGKAPWKNVLHTQVEEVRLNDEGPGCYSNEAVQLDFSGYQMAIFRTGEGLGVQIFPSKA